jgi:hypothetical protein
MIAIEKEFGAIELGVPQPKKLRLGVKEPNP